MDLNEKMETLIKQYEEVSRQAADAMTLKTKLEGALELTQSLMNEENGASENKEPKKVAVKK